MWAHYGNSHRGIAIEFDFDLLSSSIATKKEEFRVAYGQFPPHSGSQFTLVEDIRNTYLKEKSKAWEYEQEVRVITHTSGLTNINPKCIKAIYFGCRCNRFKAFRIISTFKGKDVQFYQMEHVQNAYRLSPTVLSKYGTKLSLKTGKKWVLNK